MNQPPDIASRRHPILILGAGAIGCLWSRALHQHTIEHSFILKPEHAASPSNVHVHFTSLIDTTLDLNYSVSALTAQDLTSSCDTLLVTTKANDTLSALDSMQHAIDRDTCIVLFQNGMGIQDEVCKRFPGNDIVCAVTTEGAFCTQPFHVCHSGQGQTEFGFIQTVSQQPFDTLISRLKGAYMSHTIADNITDSLWKKLCINAGINAYTVIYDCKNGELLNKPDAMRRIRTCCDELNQLGNQLNLKPHDTHHDVLKVLHNTKENHSSMHQDVSKQRLTEIEFINGYVMRLAQQHGLPCEENSAVYHEIKAIEARFDTK